MKIPVVSLLLLALPAHAATLAGLWEFNDSGNLNQATQGSALSFTGTVAATTGVSGSDGAADFAKGAWAAVTNPISANGATGTPTRTNQFTIVLDFMVPSFTDGGADNGTFTGLFDFDNGGSDADFFIRKQTGATELGVTTQWPYVGAGPTSNGSDTSGTVLANTWYRLVLASDTGVGRSVYLNGSLIGTFTAGTQEATRQSLSTSNPLRLLWDNDGETSRVLVSNLALFDGRLSATDVTALGSAGSPVPEPSSLLLGALATLAGLRRRR
ncbi:PEP-CTERM sorting domain-containing protein [Haloferula sp. BvORR071]|uniref:PEP-CTERM sorting domain-containing protein n=1 Tax=Haloferula sp. BvORR071 TaxID=1396141 RepID=UPI000557D693|nr:PEP-CTERM sorting domain-containing protein [Haloferula sp. BvORR071]